MNGNGVSVERNDVNSTGSTDGSGFDSRRLHEEKTEIDGESRGTQKRCAPACARPASRIDPAAVSAPRFWAKVERSESCWLWTGARTSRGYGCVGFGGRRYLAHRVSAALAGIDLDPTLTLDHLCRNKLCVNPAHLEQVTSGENTLRGTSPTAKNARATACAHGHPLTGENVRVRGDGRRRCRECDRRLRRAFDRAYSKRPEVKARKQAWLRKYKRERYAKDAGFREAERARKRVAEGGAR